MNTKHPKMKKRVGSSFNKLSILNLIEDCSDGVPRFECLCECGKITVVRCDSVVRGHTKSCGCIKSSSVSNAQTTHGMSGTRFYRVWASMLRRCYNPAETSYENYGGRGISVCEEWHNFEGFMKDMLGSYSKELTIERLDINKGYSNENCIWETNKKQAMNRGVQSNNLMGIANISECHKNGKLHLRGRIKNTTKNREECKVLLVEKWGYDEALLIIEEWLKQKKKELGYGKSHGDARVCYE